ncbi:hypothetical protein [Viridibacillus arvi]|uniref:hypothetical protein n=1 Tax=Viridibacillus arvi TaxID=263475 RepID=UPI003D2BC95A
MLIINNKKRVLSIGVSSIALLMLSACSMNDKIEKEIEKNESNAVVSDTETKKRDDFKMSNEQKAILDKAESQTAEEALANNPKEIKKEIKTNVPSSKAQFTEPNEFSQYIGNVLYLFHSSQIDGEKFYKQNKKYMSSYFIEQLPDSEKESINTFTEYQKMFKQQIKEPITTYQITDLTINERAKEAQFYRKYTLKSGKNIYYDTVLKEENGRWLLLDDRPSAGYEVETGQNKFHDENIGEKENDK